MESEALIAEPVEVGERPEPAAGTSAQAALAARLFAFLEERGVPYVVVGDVRDYGHTVASDIDLIVAEEALPAMSRVLAEFAAANDGRLVQAIRHERRAVYFVLAHLIDGVRVFVHPDVGVALVRRGRLLLTAEELLGGRRSTWFGASAPAPALAFAYYFVKRVDKGSLDARAFDYLQELWTVERTGCFAQLERLLPSDRVSGLASALDRCDLEKVVASIGDLQRLLHRARPITLADRWAEVRRAVDRWLRPTGLWVAFYGPDGAGKSSVIRRIEDRIAPAFRRTARYHLRPRFGRRAAHGGMTATEPHAQTARGVLGSLAKVAYWFLDATLGFWLRVRPQLVRSTLVVFDRYVDDLTVDPKRYRYGAPAWVAEALRRVTPRPHVTVVLDAPADVLQARKAEVPRTESERQRIAYRALARHTRGAVVVDTAKPLPDVVDAAETAILDRLAERTARRLGLL
jgi:thymidylate kinase